MTHFSESIKSRLSENYEIREKIEEQIIEPLRDAFVEATKDAFPCEDATSEAIRVWADVLDMDDYILYDWADDNYYDHIDRADYDEWLNDLNFLLTESCNRIRGRLSDLGTFTTEEFISHYRNKAYNSISHYMFIVSHQTDD